MVAVSNRFGRDTSGVRPSSRWVGFCPRCGKHRYLSRSDAKKACKALYPGDPMSTYQCGQYWHYGHNYRKRMP